MASTTNKANIGQLTIITINIKGAKKKADLIISLINTFNTDYILLQETNFKSKYKADTFIRSLGLETTEAYHSLGENCKGTSIIKTSDKYKTLQIYTDANGRLAIITVGDNNTQFTIVNIYAPVVKQEQRLYYKYLKRTLKKEYKDKPIILAGDFNLVIDKKDLIVQNDREEIRMAEDRDQIQTLNKIIEQFNLVDTFILGSGYHTR